MSYKNSKPPTSTLEGSSSPLQVLSPMTNSSILSRTNSHPAFSLRSPMKEPPRNILEDRSGISLKPTISTLCLPLKEPTTRTPFLCWLQIKSWVLTADWAAFRRVSRRTSLLTALRLSMTISPTLDSSVLNSQAQPPTYLHCYAGQIDPQRWCQGAQQPPRSLPSRGRAGQAKSQGQNQQVSYFHCEKTGGKN